MNTWLIIGIALVIWVLYDLISGKTWSYREIWRKYEPWQYWFFTSLWLVLAGISIYGGMQY
jgi:hypothetical protein